LQRSTFGLSSVGTALAQDTNTQTNAQADDVGLSEIIVTAEKRETNRPEDADRDLGARRCRR
jgi:hypothetical protein